VPGPFIPGYYGFLILARAVPAVAALGLCQAASARDPMPLIAAGICLPVCIWADILIAWAARRRGWVKGVSQIQLEGFVDFVCFIWAPAAWILAVSPETLLWAPAGAFVLAGCYRLARFNTEGLVAGRYRGLPVTYNGYLFPAAALARHFLAWDGSWFFGLLFLIVGALMAAGGFSIPEL
jgi:phosphatidylserine synthase